MLFMMTLAGGIFGFLLALLQVKLLRRYAQGKPPEVAQRAYDAIDQTKLTSFFGMPLIFAVIGYMLAVAWTE